MEEACHLQKPELWGPKQLHQAHSQGCLWNTHGQEATPSAAPPLQVQSTLKAQGIVKEVIDSKGKVSDEGRASPAVSCGLCPCLRKGLGVGGSVSMYETASLSEHTHLCVCVSWCLCASHLLPLFSSLPSAAFP